MGRCRANPLSRNSGNADAGADPSAQGAQSRTAFPFCRTVRRIGSHDCQNNPITKSPMRSGGSGFCRNSRQPPPAYNIPLRLVLEGDLDTNALSEALANLVVRHEALRTTFVR